MQPRNNDDVFAGVISYWYKSKVDYVNNSRKHWDFIARKVKVAKSHRIRTHKFVFVEHSECACDLHSFISIFLRYFKAIFSDKK